MSAIPTKFLGSFKLERSEGLDEIMAAKGVPEAAAEIMKKASIVKTISKVSDDGPQYHIQAVSPMKTFEWGPFKLGAPFDMQGFDGKTRKATVSVDADGNLAETCIEDNGDKALLKYTIEGDYLVLHMKHKDVTAKRFLKRV